jgi:hypothetical protein
MEVGRGDGDGEAGGGEELAWAGEVLVQFGSGAEDASVVARICAHEDKAGGGHASETADVSGLVLKKAR